MLEETGSVTRKVGSRIGFLDLVVKSLEVNITASFGVCSVRGCVSRQGSCSNERVPAILGMRGVRVLFKSSVFNEFLNEKVCKRRA